MKHSLAASVLFFWLGLSFSVVRAEGLPDGADLLIEAVRYRAANHTLVHSLSYETEQIYRKPTLSEKEVEERLNKLIATLHEAYEDATRRGILMLPVDESKNREVLRPQLMGGAVLSRFTVKYKAPSFSRKLLFLQIERQRQGVDGQTKWLMDTNVIEANVVSNKSESEGVVWFPQERSASVNDTQSYMGTLLNFGRLQGQAVPFMHILLFQDTDIEKYEFSETNIVKFKEEREKQRQAGQNKALITVGTVTYDGSAKAYIIESSTNGKVIERYWIDVNRGYVCPLLQYYDEKGKLLEEYKSENYFLHEKSGLWFPQLYKEMTRDKDDKQIFKEYRIDKSSLDVNFPIADDEFLIEIPEGTGVIDSRKGKGSKRYKAMDDGVLSLGRNGLDLEKMNWLYATEESPKAQPMAWWRIVFLVTGILLIILGFYFWFTRKQHSV